MISILLRVCEYFPWARGETRPTATVGADFWIGHNATSENHQLGKKTPRKTTEARRPCFWSRSPPLPSLPAYTETFQPRPKGCWTGSRTHRSARKLCLCCRYQHLPQMFITASVLKSSPSIHTGDLNCEDSSTPDNLRSWHQSSHHTDTVASIITAWCQSKHSHGCATGEFMIVHCAWSEHVAVKQFTRLKRWDVWFTWN